MLIVALFAASCQQAPTFTLAAEHDGLNADKYQLLVNGEIQQELLGSRRDLRFTVRIPARCTEYTVTAVNTAGSASSHVIICPDDGGRRAVVKAQFDGRATPAKSR